MAKHFIVIAGNIGSGKTTLTSLLAGRYAWEPHFESVNDNPYLADFYRDMQRWSMQLQIYFLSKRFQTHQLITRGPRSAIQDRSIYEDAHIFARTLHEAGNLEPRDFQNYLELFHTMTEFLTPPDLVIYLRCSVDCLKYRISERGREYERNIPEGYLHQLNRCYDDWIGSYKKGKVLTVNADNLDIKRRLSDFDYVCEKIESSLEQVELFMEC